MFVINHHMLKVFTVTWMHGSRGRHRWYVYHIYGPKFYYIIHLYLVHVKAFCSVQVLTKVLRRVTNISISTWTEVLCWSGRSPYCPLSLSMRLSSACWHCWLVAVCVSRWPYWWCLHCIRTTTFGGRCSTHSTMTTSISSTIRSTN